MIKRLLILNLFVLYSTAYGTLAGGRPNAFSQGKNAFSGVVNPANAVWIADRFDIGGFWVHQKSSINNHDNNPLFPAGKIDLTYRSKNLFTADAAIHKQFKLNLCSNTFDTSVSLAAFTLPSYVKLRTKQPLPVNGTTPTIIFYRTDALSAIFSLKLNKSHSIGFSIEYFYFSHRRNGYQNSDNPLKSVSPGHVTNNGIDHSNGIGFSIGWRWKISDKLDFGAAWSKKNYCGRYRKYRGFEPFHAQNYTPQTIGAGLNYDFNSKLSGQLEVLWLNLGNLPYANNLVQPDGSLNLNKRGSKKSPGPGLQDATYINIGIGYQFTARLSGGLGFSHRIKLNKNANFLSHIYKIQTVYEILSLGVYYSYQKHNLYLGFTYGFKNKVCGFLPRELGGGQFSGEKQNTSLSMSWGYSY